MNEMANTEKKEISVREWIKRFNNKEFEDPSFNTQCKAGWYDWFCTDKALKNKTKRMGRIIKQITNEFILDNCYVFFKNCCPACNPLYDTFRFCLLDDKEDDGRCYLTISLDDKNEKWRYNVYGRSNDFTTPLFQADTTKELVEYLNEGVWS